jgi:hypothetical protein
MAMASGIYGPFLRDAITNAKAFALNASDTVTWQFVSDTYTPDFNVHDEEVDITNEVTGTGYTTGGENLVSPTFAISSGFATFDGTDVSLAGTTLSGVRGMVFFDNTLAGDPLLAAVTFGADYSTSSGTFSVTFSASGIFRIDYIP